MEEITYILSHHSIKLFVGIAQGRVLNSAISKNEKVLSEVKVSSQENEEVAESRSENLDNIFNF